jgi:protein subunit release factor A
VIEVNPEEIQIREIDKIKQEIESVKRKLKCAYGMTEKTEASRIEKSYQIEKLKEEWNALERELEEVMYPEDVEE